MPPKRPAPKQTENATTQPSTQRAKALKRRAPGGAAPQQSTKRVKAQPVTESLSVPSLNATPTARLHVYVLGDGSSAGELGLGPRVLQANRPRLSHSLDPNSIGVVSLAAGAMHAAALTHDNKILTWGGNDELALGRDTSWDGGWRDIGDSSDAEEPDLNPFESTPTPIPANKFPENTKFVQVVASDSATFVLTADGHVYGWGTFRDSNGNRSFSVDSKGNVIANQASPVLIHNLKNIVQLSAGDNFVLALDSSGSVFSWGNNEQHQLGHRLRGRGASLPLLPTAVGLRNIVSVHAGPNHAFAINKNSDIWAWGANDSGQTGVTQGSGASRAIVFPMQRVKSLSKKHIKIIQGGNRHSIALTEYGQCLVWGSMDDSRTGLDLKTISLKEEDTVLDSNNKPRILLRPTTLPVPPCTHVAAGSDHNIVVTSDGRAYSWGLNDGGQCGQGPDDESGEDPEDCILVPTPIDDTSMREKEITWAAAGSQFSVLAGPSDDGHDSKPKRKSMR